MQNNKTFCILPWAQTVIRSNGDMNPCCLMRSLPFNINSTSIEEYYNSDEIVDMKQRMLSGQRVDHCKGCYDYEAKFNTSMRIEYNQNYKFIYEKRFQDTLNYFGYDKLKFPTRIELHVGNICNLKCLTCNPSESSAFLTEDKVLGISNYNQKDFTIDKNILNNILEQINQRPLEMLDLRGGESMLSPEIKEFYLNVNPTKASKIKLRIQTNATTFDAEWVTIFQKFQSIELMLSIDAYGDDNHYIRFPADWQTIIDNISQLKTITQVDHIFVNTTVSNLNWLVLPKLFDWLIENELSCKLLPLEYPPHFKVTNLPIKLLIDSIDRIKLYQTKFKFDHVNKQLQGLINHIEKYICNYTEVSAEWEKFCRIIEKRDAYRKNSIFDMLPELKEYWHDENSLRSTKKVAN